jgi:hypothetical protein
MAGGAGWVAHDYGLFTISFGSFPCDCSRVEKGEDEAWLVELGGRALIWLGDLTRYTLDLLGHDEQGRMTCGMAGKISFKNYIPVTVITAVIEVKV